MRVAVSGAHRTGKSTLVEDLRRNLPGYEAIAEPYVLLEETGHVFRHPPSLEMPQVREAMARLDLIVLVPIEHPERFSLSPEDRPRWRRAVHEELRTLLLDDPWDFGVNTMEVRGDPRERPAQVRQRLASIRAEG